MSDRVIAKTTIYLNQPHEEITCKYVDASLLFNGADKDDTVLVQVFHKKGFEFEVFFRP